MEPHKQIEDIHNGNNEKITWKDLVSILSTCNIKYNLEYNCAHVLTFII